MTVSALSRRVAYTGNGATANFAIPFQFFEVEVYVDGVLKTAGVHYTITQVSPGLAGSVTFSPIPAFGKPVVIISATRKVQETDLVDNDSSPAESIEKALDRVTMIGQDTAELDARTVRAPPFSAPLPEYDFAANPNTFFSVNGGGVLVLAPVVGPTSPFAPDLATALGYANAAAASAALSENSKVESTLQASIAQSQRVLADATLLATQAVYDAFDDRYLGVKSGPPVLDNDGATLVVGTLYFDTTLGMARVYAGPGPGWQALTAVYGQLGTEIDKGIVEFATDAESLTGTANNLAVHPKGLKYVVDNAVAALRNGVSASFDTLKEIADNIATLQAIAYSGSASDLSTGTVPAARFPAFTGDVTNVAGAIANTITNDAVTNAKLANMAALTIKGNATNATADPSDIAATVDGQVLRRSGTTVGFGTLATAGITDDAVTNVKLANVPTASIKGRLTAGTGDPEDLTPAQAKSVLAIAAADVSGLAAIATSGSASNLIAGTVPDARMPALTGDVTTVAGAVASTIVANAVTTTKIIDDAVTNAKLANVATATIKGRTTAGTGDPEDLTTTQATALLNAMVGDTGSGGTKGMVPAPPPASGAATWVLRADGTWGPQAGGGAASIVEVVVSFGSGGALSKTQDIAVLGASAGQKVQAAMSLNMPVGVDEDEFELEPINVVARGYAANVVRVQATSLGGPIFGDRKVNLILG